MKIHARNSLIKKNMSTEKQPDEKPKSLTLEEQRDELLKRQAELKVIQESTAAELRSVKNILKAFDKHAIKKP